MGFNETYTNRAVALLKREAAHITAKIACRLYAIVLCLAGEFRVPLKFPVYSIRRLAFSIGRGVIFVLGHNDNLLACVLVSDVGKTSCNEEVVRLCPALKAVQFVSLGKSVGNRNNAFGG